MGEPMKPCAEAKAFGPVAAATSHQTMSNRPIEIAIPVARLMMEVPVLICGL